MKNCKIVKEDKSAERRAILEERRAEEKARAENDALMKDLRKDNRDAGMLLIQMQNALADENRRRLMSPEDIKATEEKITVLRELVLSGRYILKAGK